MIWLVQLENPICMHDWHICTGQLTSDDCIIGWPWMLHGASDRHRGRRRTIIVRESTLLALKEDQPPWGTSLSPRSHAEEAGGSAFGPDS